jgi:hypothetical protein
MRVAEYFSARFTLYTFFVLFAASIVSCSASRESVKQIAVPPPNHPPKQMVIPDGWISLTPGQKSAGEELQLVRNDNAASMIVRELKPVASAKNSLAGEDVCTLGNISMQGKLGNGDNSRRILRLPSVIGNGKPLCVYIYSENSLLRRVLVFRSGSTIYEVELFQSSELLSFSTVVEAQTAFAKSLMNGE